MMAGGQSPVLLVVVLTHAARDVCSSTGPTQNRLSLQIGARSSVHTVSQHCSMAELATAANSFTNEIALQALLRSLLPDPQAGLCT